MKPLKKQLRPIAWLMAMVMVIQSCTVYKSTSVSLEQAVQNNSKVRIITNSNQIFIYKKIVFDKGKYYGVERIKRKKIKIPINENLVNSINLKNETLSAVLSIGIPVVLISGFLVIAAQNSEIGIGM